MVLRCTNLPLVAPQRRVQAAVGQEAGLEAGQERQEVVAGRETHWRPLDTVLTDQD